MSALTVTLALGGVVGLGVLITAAWKLALAGDSHARAEAQGALWKALAGMWVLFSGGGIAWAIRDAVLGDVIYAGTRLQLVGGLVLRTLAVSFSALAIGMLIANAVKLSAAQDAAARAAAMRGLFWTAAAGLLAFSSWALVGAVWAVRLR